MIIQSMCDKDEARAIETADQLIETIVAKGNEFCQGVLNILDSYEMQCV
jgi:hypothetical protein